LQVIGYGLSAPLFVVAAAFAMLGAGIGAALHSWTKCIDTQEVPAITSLWHADGRAVLFPELGSPVCMATSSLTVHDHIMTSC
jgi:hypothetical protein